MGNHHSRNGHIYVKVRNRKGTERGQPSFFIVDRDHFDFVVFKKKIWHTTRKVA